MLHNHGEMFFTFGEDVTLTEEATSLLFLNSTVECIHLQLSCLKSFFLKRGENLKKHTFAILDDRRRHSSKI